MTAQDIIDRARFLLKDDIEPYRLPNSDFYPWLSDGLLEMEARRSDLLMQTDGTFAAVADITAVTDVINFPTRIREALACYTAYKSYSSEDADRHNVSQAREMFTRYENLMSTI